MSFTRRRSSNTSSFHQIPRALSFDWTNRRFSSSLSNPFNPFTPSPSDPNSIFDFEMTGENRRLTPTCEKEFVFPSSSSNMQSFRPEPHHSSTEWSEYYKVGLEESANPSQSTRPFNNNQEQWRSTGGEYEVSPDELPTKNNIIFHAPRPSLLATPSLSPVLAAALPISPLRLPLAEAKTISPILVNPSPQQLQPQEVLINRYDPVEYDENSHSSTFQFNQPPPPLLSLPPAIQSRLNRSKELAATPPPSPQHNMSTRRRSSIVVDTTRSSKSGGAAAWLGMPAEVRELQMKFDSREKKPHVRVKPLKKPKKESVDDGEAAAALARSKSLARKLARKPVGYTPRPPNAWILYRSEQIRILKQDKDVSKKPQSDISKLIGYMWREESDSIRKKFEILADAAKAEHAEKYPGYRFKPIRRNDKAPSSPVEPVEPSYKRPSVPYPINTTSPHKTRSSNSGPSYPHLQFHSGSHPLAHHMRSPSRPQTPTSPHQSQHSSSDYESTPYTNYGQSQQPAFYYDNTLPSPPDSASFVYSPKTASTQVSIDPNVAAFLASLATEPSPFTPTETQDQSQAQEGYNPNNLPHLAENSQAAAQAWNEFEQAGPHWFPPSPPEVQSAPASTTHFNPVYTQQQQQRPTAYASYPLPTRNSTGSNFVERPRYQKATTWAPQSSGEYPPSQVGAQYSQYEQQQPMEVERQE